MLRLIYLGINNFQHLFLCQGVHFHNLGKIQVQVAFRIRNQDSHLVNRNPHHEPIELTVSRVLGETIQQLKDAIFFRILRIQSHGVEITCQLGIVSSALHTQTEELFKFESVPGLNGTHYLSTGIGLSEIFSSQIDLIDVFLTPWLKLYQEPIRRDFFQRRMRYRSPLLTAILLENPDNIPMRRFLDVALSFHLPYFFRHRK